jgi:hypothetical protein
MLRFAETARQLGAAARAAGLMVPAFRCPPRVPGAERTVRRYPGGSVVSVVLKGREQHDVQRDMVEGVLVVNKLEGQAASRFRSALSDAVGLPCEDARMAERQTRAA